MYDNEEYTTVNTVNKLDFLCLLNFFINYHCTKPRQKFDSANIKLNAIYNLQLFNLPTKQIIMKIK